MPDYPPIAEDLDTPLPEVDPNSEMVPYRMARTDPGQAPVITTGYGPRARRPIAPPQSMGPAPDVAAAFQHLPVDQALKAVDAAMRYQGLRGYQRDLESGQVNAAQAFAKWGPMLFRQATGIPEAIDRSVPAPISPQQLIQNRLNQQRLQMAQDAAKAKSEEPKYQKVGSDLYRILPGQDPEKIASAPTDTTTEEYTQPAIEGQEAKPASTGFLGIGAHPATPAVEARPEKKIKRTVKALSDAVKEAVADSPAPGPKTVTTKEQYDSLKSGEVYVGKDGKKYKKP